MQRVCVVEGWWRGFAPAHPGQARRQEKQGGILYSGACNMCVVVAGGGALLLHTLVMDDGKTARGGRSYSGACNMCTCRRWLAERCRLSTRAYIVYLGRQCVAEKCTLLQWGDETAARVA